MHSDETRALKRAIVILLAVSVARWGWSRRGPAPDAVDAETLTELVEETREATEESARRRAPLGENEKIDPNRASDAELDRLPGVGPSTARAIVAARDSGVVFRRPEDLLEVRGIGEGTLERMRSALEFGNPPPGRRPPPSAARPRAGGVTSSPALVDLNRADLGELEGLPGIGPAIAARILAARQERMFTSVDDLERVPGVGPATIERLRSHATVGPPR
jgi:competence ComEA-like helix-hairpin-helix protein